MKLQTGMTEPQRDGSLPGGRHVACIGEETAMSYADIE